MHLSSLGGRGRGIRGLGEQGRGSTSELSGPDDHGLRWGSWGRAPGGGRLGEEGCAAPGSGRSWVRAELPVFGPRALGGCHGGRARTVTQGPGRLVLALGRDFQLHDPNLLGPDLGDPRLQESAPPPDRLWVTLSCGRVRMGVEVAASSPLCAQSFALASASPSPQGDPRNHTKQHWGLGPRTPGTPQAGRQKQKGVLGESRSLGSCC